MAEIDYDPPTWVDGSSQAIDAHQLNHISTALHQVVDLAARTAAGKALDADTVSGYGIGVTVVPILSSQALVNAAIKGGIYACSWTGTDSPFPGADVSNILVLPYGANNITQIAWGAQYSNHAMRLTADGGATWSAWVSEWNVVNDGNGGQPPQAKGVVTTVNTVAGVAKTCFTLGAAPSSDGAYIFTCVVPGGNASYNAFAIVSMNNGGSTAFYNQPDGCYWTVSTDGAYAVRITSNTIGNQATVNCILTKIVGA